MPDIKYFFPAPGRGAIEARTSDLASPLKISLSETHPRLTLDDYFQALSRFLLEEHAETFLAILADMHNVPHLSISSLDKVDLYSEKLGVFYHIASIHIHYAGTITKLTVSTAFTPVGEKCLARDFKILNRLRTYTREPCLPRMFFMAGTRPVNGNTEDSFQMAVAEWLDGFHEWHFSHDPETGKLRIILWDSLNGSRFLQDRSAKQIFRQMARTLTICFNPHSGEQICRWHNAAGDFIVKENDGNIDTRLTTVRDYHPLMEYDHGTADNDLMRLIFFFLDLTVRISMDRLDGTGAPVWADESFLKPVLKGFLDGLLIMEDKKRLQPGINHEILQLLKHMDKTEMQVLFQPLTDIYHNKDSDMDYTLIISNLGNHIKGLLNTIKTA